MRKRLIMAAALAVAALNTPALAHHSYAMFDLNRTMALKGTVKSFEFINPHSWLNIIVDEPGATGEYRFELGSNGQLGRRGMKPSSFKPGDRINVEYHPLTSGAKGGAFVSATDPDGKPIPASQIPG
jgi:hypothetical protein